VLGKELADELLFASQRVLPAVLGANGFHFQYTELAPALRSCLG
jgi:NAD dependent epimerase/dehydratase family enzyme